MKPTVEQLLPTVDPRTRELAQALVRDFDAKLEAAIKELSIRVGTAEARAIGASGNATARLNKILELASLSPARLDKLNQVLKSMQERGEL